MEPTPPNLDMSSAGPPTPPVPPVSRSSLVARLANVFAAPSEVFDEVKATGPTVVNWLVPAILGAVVGVVAVWMLFSQPTILRQVREQQEKAIQKQVEAGKMTQQQADKTLEMMQKVSGPMMKIGGSISAVVVTVVRLFWWGLVLMLIARWGLKRPIPYLKAVEVAGLASMILVLGGIVQLLLGVIFGKMMATASLALFLKEFDFTKKAHFLLAAVNLFNFWLVAVMGLGLARLSGTGFARATLLFFAYWVVISLLLIGIGMGQFAL